MMTDSLYVCHFLRKGSSLSLIRMLFLLLLLKTHTSYSYNVHGNSNGSGFQQQVISEEPQDQQAKIGDKALLKCRIKNMKGEPQWCIDDFCLGVSKTELTSGTNHLTLKGRPRYRIVGDKSKGEFDLLIEPVQLQDNMFFYCMATAASETIRAVKSKKIFLTVLSKFFNLLASSAKYMYTVCYRSGG